MPDLAPLRERIEACLDEKGVVRDEASPLLARVRREMGELNKKIDGAVRALLSKSAVKAALADPNTRRRGGRIVLSVRTGNAGKVPGIVHDRSNTGETLFIEPREIVLPGNRLAELASEERREIERILLELTRAALDERPRIEAACGRLASLELALVAASFATETGARCSPGIRAPRLAFSCVRRDIRCSSRSCARADCARSCQSTCGSPRISTCS